MRKWVVIGIAAGALLMAVTVFALQVKNSTPVPAAASPQAQDASYSGCGAGAGCGAQSADGAASGGCGASASGGCGSAASSPEAARERLEKIQAYLTDYYTKKLGGSDIKVQVQDYGCHQEATVLKGAQVVDRLSISGNSITRIEG
ncbi:MAG: hypothetical protein JSV00_08915 [bacterium]|nr:MAG: hypothetical protein JSV00_08915 [bacterium]